jgi:hypothetical protein
MVGKAVATTVWSSDAINKASINPLNISHMLRWSAVCVGPAWACSTDMMRLPFIGGLPSA